MFCVKYKNASKRAGGVAQANKHKALSSNPSTTKKKKEKKNCRQETTDALK
jgi:hypothetical protein